MPKPKGPNQRNLATDPASKQLNEQFDKVLNDLQAIQVANGSIGILDIGKPQEQYLTFKEFVTSPEHMGYTELSEKQDRLGQWMTGFDNPERALNQGGLAVLLWGKGAGKDWLSVLIQLYFVKMFVDMKEAPQIVLGLCDKNAGSPYREPIDLLNVSNTASNANRVYFHKLRQHILNWPWLNKRYPIRSSGTLLNPDVKHLFPTEEVEIKGDSIIFPRNIRCFSGHAQQDTWEGLNLYLFIMDEASSFKDETDTQNAWKVFRMLRTSASSRFQNRYKGFVISFPRYQDDFTIKMYEWGVNKAYVFADKASSWEVNPHLMREEKVQFKELMVPVSKLQDFEDDEMDSRRKYLCDPPLAEQPFIEEKPKYEKAIDVKLVQLFEFQDYEVVENGMTLVRKRILKANLPSVRRSYIMSYDLGFKNCSAALALSYMEKDTIYLNFITAWIPDKKRGVMVDLINFEEIMDKIRAMVNVVGVYSDPWNSAALMLKMRAAGVISDQLMLGEEDFSDFRTLLYQEKFKTVNYPPLFTDMQKVQLVKGRQIVSGDIIDAVVSAVKAFLLPTKQKQRGNQIVEGEIVGENIWGGGGDFSKWGKTQPGGLTWDKITKELLQ